MIGIARQAPTRPTMSWLIHALTLVALVGAIVVPGGPAEAETPGLVAAYGFDEASGATVADASGNNNTGTFGSGVTRTTAGRYGSALVFDGTGFVTIPNAAVLQLTTGMTLSAW